MILVRRNRSKPNADIAYWQPGPQTIFHVLRAAFKSTSGAASGRPGQQAGIQHSRVAARPPQTSTASSVSANQGSGTLWNVLGISLLSSAIESRSGNDGHRHEANDYRDRCASPSSDVGGSDGVWHGGNDQAEGAP